MRDHECWYEIAAAEPVYRASIGRLFLGRVNLFIGEICAGCAAKRSSHEKWRSPKPCERCGRMVIGNGNRSRWEDQHVACSDKCRRAVYSAIHRAKHRRAPEPLICASCSTLFTPKRSDARFCSKSCKQKAFRRRIAAD
jgi:hypothetical protein